MALIVEDGSVVSNAESYTSVSDADTYWSDRNDPSEWSGATTAQKETALRYATQWLDMVINWVSNKSDPDNQELEWPRVAYTGADGKTYGGSTSGDIPQKLKDATAEMALRYLQSDFTQPSKNGSLVKRERIGTSEVEYNSTKNSNSSFKYIYSSLRYLGTPKKAAIKLLRA